MSGLPLASTFNNECVCLGVRRAARFLTRRYDEAFRDLGLTSGQFSILAALARDDAVPVGLLAEALGLERTTLSRNLKPLVARGWIELEGDKGDARVRGLKLSQTGRDLLEAAIPVWQTAQEDTKRRLRKGGWPAFRSRLNAVT